MNVQSLTKGLKYIGEAEGKRQTYYVFEGEGYFLVISFKKGDPTTGNFSVVESEAGLVQNQIDDNTKMLPPPKKEFVLISELDH